MSALPTTEDFGDYDWEAVLFGGDAYSGTFEAVAGGGGDRCEDITEASIAEVIAWHTDSTEGWASTDLVALVRLMNGKYAAVTAWCDTSGWDCRSDAQWRVSDNRGDVVRYGLDDAGRHALGLVIDA